MGARRSAEEAGMRRAEEPSGTGAWGGAGEREPGRRGFGRLRSRDHDQMAEMRWQTQGRERADSLCSFYVVSLCINEIMVYRCM